MFLTNINESYIINEKDIYYNKDKFNSGEINLCFITGLCGSGKSTLGRKMAEENKNIEHYELDDIYCNNGLGVSERFTMEQFKQYGDLIYSFFNTVGRKYYITMEEVKKLPPEKYEDKLFIDFCRYAMKYAASHRNKKYVIEGIYFYLYNNVFSPSMFDNYAFYIKGTSTLVSKIRSAKRDSYDSDHKILNTIKLTFRNNKFSLISEKRIKEFRQYFKNKMKLNEASYTFLENKNLPDFKNKIIKKFNRDEMLTMEKELRLVYFLRIESIMKKSPYFNDLYSVSLPKESLYHTEKLRNLRLFVGKYQNTVDYSDRLSFKYTILDPKCPYKDGIYQKYSMSEFNNLLIDARKIIKSVTPNFQILHQRNLQTLENYEIYNSPSCEFVFRLSYYPNRKIWIDILSREE